MQLFFYCWYCTNFKHFSIQCIYNDFFLIPHLLFDFIGREAVGVVTAVGQGLTGRKVGDLVAYAGNPMGSYAEEQILPANQVVPFPSTLDPILGAAVMLKGMTVQYLLRSCFKVYIIITCALISSIHSYSI
jgi:NADPH:quinone reductase-like Zn-dependent oxidoreductase